MHGYFLKLVHSDLFFKYAFLIGILGTVVWCLFDTIGSVVSLFFVSFVFAYILNKPVQQLTYLRCSRTLAAIFVMLLVVVGLILLVLFAFPYINEELMLLTTKLIHTGDILLQRLPLLIEDLQKHSSHIDFKSTQSYLTPHVEKLAQWIFQAIIGLLSGGFAVASILSWIILTPILTFYFLKDWPILVNALTQLYPKGYQQRIGTCLTQIDATLVAYAKGQLTVSLILTLLYSSSLTMIGLNQALLIGFITGFFSMIPFVGIVVGCCMALTVGFSTSTPLWGILLTYTLIPLFETNFLTPRFIGGRIGVHPLLILFGVLTGGKLFGLVGLFLALPVTAVVATLTKILLEGNKNDLATT